MNGQMSIYYDEEADYLEIYIEGAGPAFGEEISEDITLFKNEKSKEVVGIGINNFKKRTHSLQELKLNLPFKVNFSSLKSSA